MKLFSFIVNFFYPNHCLHCFDKVEKKYFCENCINFFSFIPPIKGQFCFAVFEKTSPIESFLKEIKRNKIYGLIKLAASFIVVQHGHLNWEMPDVIIPVTKNRIFKDHIFYLSKEVATLFNKPVKFESKPDQKVLFIDDVFNPENIKKGLDERRLKKAYYLSLFLEM